MNRPAKVTQGEISRALRAAKQAGGDLCVEIMPDGTIRITPAKPSPQPTGTPLAPERDFVL